MPEIAEQIFDLPIRRGAPSGVGGLADHVGSPSFATPVGLVLYGQRNQIVEATRTSGAGAFGHITSRLKSIFREFF
jgi:cell division protein FtsA